MIGRRWMTLYASLMSGKRRSEHKSTTALLILVYIVSPNMDANFYIFTSPFSAQSVQLRGDSPSYMGNDGKGSTVNKKYCFRMMVWLCAYYEFYDKKVPTVP